ncbi:MAG: flavin reductase family protein [Chloroflexi bacterium]|nr:flavin reductase family protein [Chloroflexota bacterium]
MNNIDQKELRRPTTALYPVPVVLVTCADDNQRPNIITLAWVGVVCSDPPQIGVAVRPSRYSHALMEKSGQFVINIPGEDLVHAADLCGTISGRDTDKFAEAGLTPEPAAKVSPPLIAECPVNMECLVRQKLSLGSHDLFIGEVVAVHVDRAILSEGGRIDYGRARPLIYNNGEYRGLGNILERHGFARHRKA